MNIYDPVPSVRSRRYWDGIAAGELRYQGCTECDARWMSARDACPACASNAEWRVAKGTGTVYSYSVVYRAPTPDLRDRVPYILGLVELDEGPRMLTWVVHAEPDELAIGAAVELEIGLGPGSQAVPLFRLKR